MSLFIKIWHTFPLIIKPRSAHANHSLKAIEMSFVLIRLISDTNQRRWILTFIFPPASQFQNINVLDGLIEPDNEFSSDAGWRVILLFFPFLCSITSITSSGHHLDQYGLIWSRDCYMKVFQGQHAHFLHIREVDPNRIICSMHELDIWSYWPRGNLVIRNYIGVYD